MSASRRFMPSRRAGFSLIELSVVMAILSICAVLGLEAAASFIARTAVVTTRERLAAIDQALVKYRFVYGRLPCPAPTAVGPTDSSYGKEAIDGSNACTESTITGTTTLRFGDVPVRDLNLPLTYMKDAYGQKFRYVLTQGLQAAATYGAQADVIQIRSGKLEATCTTLCQDVGTAAYVVLSHGADKRRQGTASTGGPTFCIPSSASAGYSHDGMIDSQNCRVFAQASMQLRLGSSLPATAGSTITIPTNVFYDSRYNPGSVEENHFDDLIVWRPKSAL